MTAPKNLRATYHNNLSSAIDDGSKQGKSSDTRMRDTISVRYNSENARNEVEVLINETHVKYFRLNLIEIVIFVRARRNSNMFYRILQIWHYTRSFILLCTGGRVCYVTTHVSRFENVIAH